MSLKPITIRNLGPEDAHILDRVKPGTFDGLDVSRAWAVLATRVNEFVVALDQGEVVGFVYGTMLMRPDGPSVFMVSEVRVHEAYRRQGIGRRLMARLGALAEDRGCEFVSVALAEHHGEAGAFFDALDQAERGAAIVYKLVL